MRSANSNWARGAKALFLKDIRAELRSKVAVNAVGIFAFSSMLLLTIVTAVLRETKGFSARAFFEAYGIDKNVDLGLNAALSPAWDSAGKMGLLWVLLIFAAFAGLSHSFVHEEEAGTTTALRLAMPAEAVFAGKLLFNLVMIFTVALILTPAYMLLTGMTAGNPLVFISLMVSGCTGLGGTATIIAALAAKARSTGALYGALGLPFMFVFITLLINASNTLYDPKAGAIEIVKNVGGVFAYGVAIIAISTVVFRVIWED